MTTEAMDRVRGLLETATGAEKCRPCGCFHQAIAALEGLGDDVEGRAGIASVLAAAEETVEPKRYGCKGCDPCWPADALSELVDAGLALPLEDACLSRAAPKARSGWPPLPGNYRVLRHEAPVAVCTLGSEALMDEIAGRAPRDVAIVGTLETENLGIERLIRNVTANPKIRRLVLCGPDSRRAVGHRPGASLLAFAANGVDGDRKIVGAPGRRPILKNVPEVLLARFRENVEVVDLVGSEDPGEILDAVAAAPAASAANDRVPAPPADEGVPFVEGRLPDSTTPDPAGWFVVHLDRRRGRILLEHYRNDGTLTAVIEGAQAAECWFPAIERGLVSRLDHAAYLGRELTRAEAAIRGGTKYVQDHAPDLAARDG